MNQVHKENLTQVENALPNRQGLEVEIFGMEGIPQEILDQHRNRIIQNFYQAQEDRRLATGNPLPGQAMKRKKLTTESADELKKRLEEFRAQKKAGGAVEAPTSGSPGQYVSYTVSDGDEVILTSGRMLPSSLLNNNSTNNTTNSAIPPKHHPPHTPNSPTTQQTTSPRARAPPSPTPPAFHSVRHKANSGTGPKVLRRVMISTN